MVSEPTETMADLTTIASKGTDTLKPVAPMYQLAANENPGAVIAQVQFTGDKFDEWAQAVRTALRVKKKYGFVNDFEAEGGHL